MKQITISGAVTAIETAGTARIQIQDVRPRMVKSVRGGKEVRAQAPDRPTSAGTGKATSSVAPGARASLVSVARRIAQVTPRASARSKRRA